MSRPTIGLLPEGAPIHVPSPQGRLPDIQQRMIGADCDASFVTPASEIPSTVTVPTDPTTLAVPDRTTDFESVGAILRRLRG